MPAKDLEARKTYQKTYRESHKRKLNNSKEYQREYYHNNKFKDILLKLNDEVQELRQLIKQGDNEIVEQEVGREPPECK